MSRTNNWQEHWLDLDCDGLLLREWCTNSTKQPGFAHCKVCNLTLKYLKIGVRALKDHGKSKKHLENCKAAAEISVTRSLPSHTKDGSLENQSYSSDHEEDGIRCGKEKLLKADLPSDAQFQRTQVQEAIGTTLGPVPYYQVSSSEDRNALIPVYPCCFCPEEFVSKHMLHDHQASCIMKPPVLQAVIPTDNESAPCILEDDSPPSIGPKMNESVHTMSSDWYFNHHLLWPSKSEFITGLGLLSKKKAQQVSQRRRNTECENIDWDEEIPITPTTPSSTRTPKLLISHLSRDGNDNYRRRLSFTVDGKEDKDKDSMRGCGSQENAVEEHGDERQKKMTVCKSLYNLDVTSPLGQCVIKHFKGDPVLHILSDIESHCLTSSAPRNSSTSRLRVRNVTYSITFRGYSAKCGIYAHQYKFNKKEIREFMKTVNTGLNKESRRLYRQMKPCKVFLKHVTKADLKYWIPSQNQLTIDLKPLSVAEIAFWTMPKPTPSIDSLSIFPKGLNFASPNVNSILGLKTKQTQSQSNNNLGVSSLTLSNFVSEEICAELVQNRKALYRCLLSDCHSYNRDSFLSKNELHCTSRPPSYSLLRQMLVQNPNACDLKSKKVSKSSAVSFPVRESHLSLTRDSRDKMTLTKTNNSTVGTKFSDSLMLQLTPVDIQKLHSFDIIKPHSLSCKKRKLSIPSSVDIDACIKTAIPENGTKFLGGFSVKVRPANEGEEITTFTKNQHKSSLVSTFQDMEGKSKSKKIGKKSYCTERASSRQVPVNEFSSQTRNLRSSLKVPLSKPRRIKVRDKSSCLNDRGQNQPISTSLLNFKRRNMSGYQNSIRKCLKKETVLEQTSQQCSKSHHVTSHRPCPTLEDNLRLVENKSQILRSFKGSMAFKQKLDAEGLGKTHIESSAPNSHVLGRQMKHTVPTSNKISRNLSALSTSPKSMTLSDNLKDQRFTSGKHSQIPVLRNIKSQSSAYSLAQPNQHIDRRKYKDEKHKSFMLWLQNLRKGNIT